MLNNQVNNILDRLSQSKFRNSFHLKNKDIIYINEKFILCFDLLVMSLKTILIITSNIN